MTPLLRSGLARQEAFHFLSTKKATADEDRTRNLRLRKATRYHCATTAFQTFPKYISWRGEVAKPNGTPRGGQTDGVFGYWVAGRSPSVGHAAVPRQASGWWVV